jgi:hypothetical protein
MSVFLQASNYSCFAFLSAAVLEFDVCCIIGISPKCSVVIIPHVIKNNQNSSTIGITSTTRTSSTTSATRAIGTISTSSTTSTTSTISTTSTSSTTSTATTIGHGFTCVSLVPGMPRWFSGADGEAMVLLGPLTNLNTGCAGALRFQSRSKLF